MKKLVYTILLSVTAVMIFLPAYSHAFGGGQPPWDAPIMPGAKMINTEGTAAYYEVDKPYDAVLAWYQETLKNYRDMNYAHVNWAKYRDWKDQMYIEDQGGAPWHSSAFRRVGGAKQR